jgi:hypothetical protein
MQGLSSDDFAPAKANNRRSMTICHELLKMSSGYPKGLRCLLDRKSLNGSIVGSCHPAHLVTSVASHSGLRRSNRSGTTMSQGAVYGKAGAVPVPGIPNGSLACSAGVLG